MNLLFQWSGPALLKHYSVCINIAKQYLSNEAEYCLALTQRLFDETSFDIGGFSDATQLRLAEFDEEDEIRKNIDSVDERIEEKRKVIHQKKDLLRQLRAENQKLRGKINDLDQSYQRQQEEYLRLRLAESAEEDKIRKNMDSVDKRIEEKREVIHQKENLLCQLRAENQELQGKIDDLDQSYRHQQEKHQRLTGNLSSGREFFEHLSQREASIALENQRILASLGWIETATTTPQGKLGSGDRNHKQMREESTPPLLSEYNVSRATTPQRPAIIPPPPPRTQKVQESKEERVKKTNTSSPERNVSNTLGCQLLDTSLNQRPATPPPPPPRLQKKKATPEATPSVVSMFELLKTSLGQRRLGIADTPESKSGDGSHYSPSGW